MALYWLADITMDVVGSQSLNEMTVSMLGIILIAATLFLTILFFQKRMRQQTVEEKLLMHVTVADVTMLPQRQLFA